MELVFWYLEVVTNFLYMYKVTEFWKRLDVLISVGQSFMVKTYIFGFKYYWVDKFNKERWVKWEWDKSCDHRTNGCLNLNYVNEFFCLFRIYS